MTTTDGAIVVAFFVVAIVLAIALAARAWVGWRRG